MFAIARVIGVIAVPCPMACLEQGMNMDYHMIIASQGVVHQAAQNRTMEAAECVLKGMDMPSAALVRKDRRQKPDSACGCFVGKPAPGLDHFDNLT